MKITFSHISPNKHTQSYAHCMLNPGDMRVDAQNNERYRANFVVYVFVFVQAANAMGKNWICDKRRRERTNERNGKKIRIHITTKESGLYSYLWYQFMEILQQNQLLHIQRNTNNRMNCISIIHSWINHLIRVAMMRMRITRSLHLMKQHQTRWICFVSRFTHKHLNGSPQ